MIEFLIGAVIAFVALFVGWWCAEDAADRAHKRFMDHHRRRD